MPKKSVQDLMYSEIKEMNAKLDRVLEQEIPDIKGDIKVLKVKSGVWGAFSGLLGGVLVSLGFSR